MYGDLADICVGLLTGPGEPLFTFHPCNVVGTLGLPQCHHRPRLVIKLDGLWQRMFVPHPAVPDLGDPDISLSRMNLRGLLNFSIIPKHVLLYQMTCCMGKILWILAMREGGARLYPRRGLGERLFVVAVGLLYVYLPGLLPLYCRYSIGRQGFLTANLCGGGSVCDINVE